MSRRTSLNIFLTVPLLPLAIVCVASGDVIYVDDNATGANDGSSWANAYIYLQDALADAKDSEKPIEIHVAWGIYKPDQGESQTPGDREATFQLISGVSLRGGYAGVLEPHPNVRDVNTYAGVLVYDGFGRTERSPVLSGDLASNDAPVIITWGSWREPTRAENSYHVVTASGTDSTAVLDGFIVTSGNADGSSDAWQHCGGGMYNHYSSPTVVSCSFEANMAARGGGGMSNRGSNPTVTDCRFAGNLAYDDNGGGGVYNLGGTGEFRHCVFLGNSGHGGGGIHNESSDPTLIHCSFTQNQAVCIVSAAGPHTKGGGMWNEYSDPVLVGCTFTSNLAERAGGGMANESASNPVLTNCTFSGNRALGIGGSPIGFSLAPKSQLKCGSMVHQTDGLILGSSTTTGYVAWEAGGGMANERVSNPILTNCTFSGNEAKRSGGGICSIESKPTLTNCILWGNILTTKQLEQISGDAAVSYSNIQGGWPGEGNLDTDPLFANPGVSGDYHLKSQAGRWDRKSQSWVTDDVTSPCINGGDPMLPIGYEPFPNGGRINMGAYGGTAEASKSYFGEPVCETIVAGDINGDCKVDFVDFAIMALHWLEDNRP